MIKGNETRGVSSNRSDGLLQSSILSIFIPQASSCDIENLLRDSIKCSHENEFPPVSIPQRQLLFFDETLDVYITLMTSCYDEKIPNSFLNSLIISIEARVFNSSSENNDFSQAYETIFSEFIHDNERPQFIIQIPNKSNKTSAYVKYLFVWKVSIILDKLRIRFQNPSITLSAKSSLRHEKDENATVDNQYLPSCVPSSFNTLEAFENDTSMNGVKPWLSAARISRVIPSKQKVANSLSFLKSTSFQPIKILPAFHAGIKYSKLITVTNITGLIASLEITSAPLVDCEIIIKRIGLNLKDGRVDDLYTKFGITLPVVCSPKETIIFTHFLTPNEIGAKSPKRDLEISIVATANVSSCFQSLIEMCWTSSLSFMPPINPGFGTPTSSIKRSHRPFQLSVDNDVADSKMIFSDLEAFTLNRRAIDLKPSPSVTEFGVTVSITNSSASTPIYPGVPFNWNAFLFNQSDRPRKLALDVLCKPFLFEGGLNQDPSPHSLEQLNLKVANAVVNESILLRMQKNSCRVAKLICLTTSQEIGPLSPMTCHEVELNFIALDTGIISIEAVRIVDLDNTTFLDIHDLPFIFVSPIPKHS